ncbi:MULTISPECIES: DUF817 family protein [Asaia]|uniref:DUF817 family protein n=1 Tax=Asaia TaxID=91914 RepID=UPI002553C188|nr:DUF817 family protein [Asaia sp. HumB]MDL2169874.1 DUF817 family protein [Asaia sp. HumB]
MNAPSQPDASATANLEHELGRVIRRYLHGFSGLFVLFVLKQGWACLFGGLMLAAILAFHITGTAMEWFKVSAGSWAYPEPGFFKILHVPLFSGFMYASVGSYMARVIRLFDMRFEPYPDFRLSLLLALAIYANFFTHHYLPDLRWLLVLATVLLYRHCVIHYRIVDVFWRMPLPLAAFFSSVALWIAENIGTFTGTWLYAKRDFTWVVHPQKLVSWYLLLYVAFITVTLLLRPDRPRDLANAVGAVGR